MIDKLKRESIEEVFGEFSEDCCEITSEDRSIMIFLIDYNRKSWHNLESTWKQWKS